MNETFPGLDEFTPIRRRLQGKAYRLILGRSRVDAQNQGAAQSEATRTNFSSLPQKSNGKPIRLPKERRR